MTIHICGATGLKTNGVREDGFAILKFWILNDVLWQALNFKQSYGNLRPHVGFYKFVSIIGAQCRGPRMRHSSKRMEVKGPCVIGVCCQHGLWLCSCHKYINKAKCDMTLSL